MAHGNFLMDRLYKIVNVNKESLTRYVKAEFHIQHEHTRQIELLFKDHSFKNRIRLADLTGRLGIDHSPDSVLINNPISSHK